MIQHRYDKQNRELGHTSVAVWPLSCVTQNPPHTCGRSWRGVRSDSAPWELAPHGGDRLSRNTFVSTVAVATVITNAAATAVATDAVAAGTSLIVAVIASGSATAPLAPRAPFARRSRTPFDCHKLAVRAPSVHWWCHYSGTIRMLRSPVL